MTWVYDGATGAGHGHCFHYGAGGVMSCLGNVVEDGTSALKRVRPPRKRRAPISWAGSTVTLNSPHRSPNDPGGVVMVAPDACLPIEPTYVSYYQAAMSGGLRTSCRG